LCVVVVGGVEIALGTRRTAYLRYAPCGPGFEAARVSVIVAARDEEKKIREALGSLLKQDYGNLEFIVVNDRSSDRTGAIVAEMAAADPRLRAVNITELQAGWLGKNYALYRGAEAASGGLLLFTDADVVMDPSTMARAVGYLEMHGLDHLAAMPAVKLPSLPLRLFCSTFGIFFSGYLRPWKAKDPRSRAFIGIGAFNLVTAEAYQAAGTHRAIAMRPDDDVKLGKILKKAGFRQEMVLGMGLLSVEWYSSLRELIEGLRKNFFGEVGGGRRCGVAAARVAVRGHFCGRRLGANFVCFGGDGYAALYFRCQSFLRPAAMVCAGASAFRDAIRLHSLEIDGADAADRRHQLAREALPAGAAQGQSGLASQTR